MGARPDPAEVVRAVLHEVRSRIGAIRLAVTTLQDGDPGEPLRGSLLQTADRETIRISTELAAVTALVACLTDRSTPGEVELGGALRRAASATQRLGVHVKVRGRGPAVIRARSASVDSALPALLRLVADGDGEALASLKREAGDVVVRLHRADDAPISAGNALVRNLVEGMGGTRVECDGGLTFSISEVRPR